MTCLRRFGIDLPAHPTFKQVQAEYEAVWSALNGRAIESLIDLPLIVDPEVQAAIEVFSVLTSPAYFTDAQLFCLFRCRMVRIGMQHGMGGPSAHSCILRGYVLGPVFHRYAEGYRFAKLACDLVEKRGFIAYQARVHHAMALVALWTRPIQTAIDLTRAAFHTATETGDLPFACFAMYQIVTVLLLRNVPLDAVWRESEMALDFARKAKYGDAAQVVVSQRRFIATMQGRTATFSTFSGAQFDEATFEAQLTRERMISMVCCFYWILKLEARFLSGDYAEALSAADKAKPQLWAAVGQIQLLDYFYYTALTVASLYETASADEHAGWRELLTAHEQQLREWAENYPPTFADKDALVSAEIARLEKRDGDAMCLYEQAIRLAREHGFIKNEALAHELTARYYWRAASTQLATPICATRETAMTAGARSAR